MVKLEGDEIVIRVKANVLEHAMRYSNFGQAVEDHDGKPITVTDTLGFARDVVSALQQEEEDGSTPVHRMLDKASQWAVEQGSEHVECL